MTTAKTGERCTINTTLPKSLVTGVAYVCNNCGHDVSTHSYCGSTRIHSCNHGTPGEEYTIRVPAVYHRGRLWNPARTVTHRPVTFCRCHRKFKPIPANAFLMQFGADHVTA